MTPAHPHIIDLYAKDGAAQGYLARFILIEQYGIGIVVLTAGPGEVLNPLAEAILATIVPAAEEEARVQAKKYVGNFSTPSNTTPELATNLSLSIDQGPGIKIDHFYHNNSDMLEGIKIL